MVSIADTRGPTPGAERPGPGGYGAWVGWLEAFRRGEEPPTGGLEPIDGRLPPFVEARLLDRLSAAVTERLRRWRADLAADVVSAPPADEEAVAALLAVAVRRLDPLERLAAAPVVPDAVADAIRSALADTRASARSALEDARRRMDEETLVLPVVPSVPAARSRRRRSA